MTAMLAALTVLATASAVARPRTRRVGASSGRPSARWRRPPRPDVARLLDDVARRVRAGESTARALAGASSSMPVPAAVEHAVGRYRRGLALADACRPIADDPDPATALAGATLCAVARFGGAGGRALDAAAAALRERSALAAEVRAQAATARLSALVLVVLPVGFAGWTVATDRAARAFLLGTPLGWAVAGAGGALDVVGAWWMRRLVRAVELP